MFKKLIIPALALAALAPLHADTPTKAPTYDDWEMAYLHPDMKRNTWEHHWRFNAACLRLIGFTNVVVVRIEDEYYEQRPGLADELVVTCTVESAIKGELPPGTRVEFRLCPEEKTGENNKGERFILSFDDIQDGKAQVDWPDIHSYEHYHEAYTKVKADLEKNGMTPPPPTK